MAFLDRGSGILITSNVLQDGDWRTSKMDYGDNKDSSVPRDAASPHSVKDDVIWKRVAGNTLLGGAAPQTSKQLTITCLFDPGH